MKCRAPAGIKPSATLRHERCCWVSTAAQQMNAETSLHRLQIDAKSCVPSWNRAETGRVSHLAGGQSRDEDGLWCLQWFGSIHFFCESTRSFKCQEIESAFSFRHLHHHHDSHSEEDRNHVMNFKKKKNEDAVVTQVVLARLLFLRLWVRIQHEAWPSKGKLSLPKL